MPESYQRELKTAIEAAHHAGAMLRDEFHRPGGPRGEGGHAEIDEVAEAEIRRILLAAFPRYGYRGEELGFTGPARDPGGHTWIVDPNDGTSNFLRGFRGSSVSIALLRGGAPVLGVVYAFCAPDGGGDLITWAEDGGPVRRNDTPVHRTWPSAVTERSTVLVTTYAEFKPELNARALAPARFRGLSSIAYRLALVAAGDADATLSLSASNAWDFAAGHALLIGSGANLHDGRGQVVGYTVDGESDCHGAVYGGPEPLVLHLMDGGWRDVVRAPRDGTPPFCRPLRGRAAADAGVLGRAQGCLIGQFAGDSLGSLVEFQSPEEIARAYPEGLRELRTGGVWGTIAGQPTDDSEMALALARSLVRAHGYDQARARRAYEEWYRSEPFDIGATTRGALGGGAANTTSQGNGALMRVSPIGVALEPDAAYAAGLEDAALTHPHPVCREASAVFAAAVSYAIRSGAGPDGVFDFAAARVTDAALRKALDASRREPPPDYLHQQGWVVTAFHNAFHQLLHTGSVEEGVVNTVAKGGDTDTNGAIAGALLGAVHGVQRIPRQWTDRVITCRPLKGLAGVRRPRPMDYWPVDALTLAERLLIL
jgi:ADP-ribosyl-[dinitrogen reductase] hydrolase